MFYQLIKEYDKAEKQYLKAIAIDPKYKKVHENYASLKQQRAKVNRKSAEKEQSNL